MTALYAGLGATGYQSKGSAVSEIVIFSLGEGPAGRVAAACILVQALSQCEGAVRGGGAGGAEAAKGAVLRGGDCSHPIQPTHTSPHLNMTYPPPNPMHPSPL
jgi:hypothetical protein